MTPNPKEAKVLVKQLLHYLIAAQVRSEALIIDALEMMSTMAMLAHLQDSTFNYCISQRDIIILYKHQERTHIVPYNLSLNLSG